MAKRFDQTVAQAPAQTSGANRNKTGANEWNLEFGLPKKAQISRIVQLAPAQTNALIGQTFFSSNQVFAPAQINSDGNLVLTAWSDTQVAQTNRSTGGANGGASEVLHLRGVRFRMGRLT
jgi:hypothetical protein